MKPFPIVFFDIVGVCNAKCPYCVTGANKKNAGGVISIDLFSASLKRLLERGIIVSNSTIYLYNWGEPFLHPDIYSIGKVINELKLKYAISTNASKIPEVNKPLVENLSEVLFSMPGFSQRSYDKIHGFNFERIKQNIVKLVNDLRSYGYRGDFIIAYHVYRFNLNEMKDCERFANSIGAEFSPRYAILNDWWQLKGWLDGSLPDEKRAQISKDLFITGIKETMNNSPENYRCPQLDLLVIDEYANVLTCCVLPKNHPDCSAGNINREDMETVLENRAIRPVCIECRNSGLAYYLNTALFFPEFYRLGFRQIVLLVKKNKIKKAIYHLAPGFLKRIWWRLKGTRL